MLIEPFDPQLDPHFSVFNQAIRRRHANTWHGRWLPGRLGQPLPAQAIAADPGDFGQLVVMICPSGTYVACMGKNNPPEAVQN